MLVRSLVQVHKFSVMLSHIACDFMTLCDILCLVVPDLFPIFTHLCLCRCLRHKSAHTHTLSHAQNRLYLQLLYMIVLKLYLYLYLYTYNIFIYYYYTTYPYVAYSPALCKIRFIRTCCFVYCLFVYSWFDYWFSDCVFGHLMCIHLSHHRHWYIKIHKVCRCILAIICNSLNLCI